ncbi:hypothetical protein DPMN_011675 [Dreissena polymorpha]|uniref:Uncharacterized protein n=1 Tax=Dreissena polymorpha TaxID=45954 RepID=A0A9D4S2Q3_DREPO|nr:hypothetical protein DPMN_011675 [Dreissena polymorpha]
MLTSRGTQSVISRGSSPCRGCALIVPCPIKLVRSASHLREPTYRAQLKVTLCGVGSTKGTVGGVYCGRKGFILINN